MKKAMIILSIAVSSLLMSCSDDKTQRVGIGSIRVVEVEGHDYVVFKMGYGGGIVHAESCECKEAEFN